MLALAALVFALIALVLSCSAVVRDESRTSTANADEVESAETCSLETTTVPIQPETTSSIGTDGSVGPAGATGQTGATGPQGEPGLTGSQGAAGSCTGIGLGAACSFSQSGNVLSGFVEWVDQGNKAVLECVVR